MANRISRAYPSHNSFGASRPVNPSLCKRIEDSGRAYSEFLLPILVQLHYNMEEELAFERNEKEWGKGQIDELSLKLKLPTSSCEGFDRMAYVLDMAYTHLNQGSSLVQTKCGTDAYIH